MNKVNILFVSVAFPPKSDAECLQVAKYFHFLQKHQTLQIDVVTSAVPTLYMPFDTELIPYSSGVRKLISVKLYENRYINFILNRLGFSQYLFPDSKRSFHAQFNKVVNQILHKPDILYSRSHPISSTILAYKLHKHFNIPWILHLSDLWANSPLDNRSSKVQSVHNKWEKKCFEAADIITLTSISTINWYKKKYPYLAEKFRFYPNVYDQNMIKPKEDNVVNKNSHVFRIIMTGNMAGDRSPEYILEPLRKWHEKDSSIAGRIKFIIAGEADSKNRSVIEKYNLPFFEWMGKVSYNDSLMLQNSANYLVSIDNPILDPNSAVFFPSKLLDYMLAKKRILAITSKGSETEHVMLDIKGDVCYHNEDKLIQDALINALTAFDENNSSYLECDFLPFKYDAKYNADRLFTEICQLLNE